MQARITSVGLVIQPDPTESFAYPDHIERASLDALPSRPGIYIFRDEDNRPLYIGKSVNIRSRVLSHLRTPEEARMLKQSRRVEFRRTAGEIGALLLESRLIKDMQPLHNKKLRRRREMCALRLAESPRGPVPEVAYAREHDFASTGGLYGLFATRRAALEKLRAIVDEHGLCPALTGLESTMRGRACFARQLARCRGACVGAESALEHAARLRAALEDLRVITWPYPGAMGIVEEYESWRQTHVIDRWFYLGSIEEGATAPAPEITSKPAFDVDTYQILVKPMLRGELRIEPVHLPRPPGKT